MRFIRFPQGDGEVLIDPEKVSHIKKRKRPSNEYGLEEPIVYVLFGGSNEWVEFNGKDAENVWDYFIEHFVKKNRENF